VSQYRWTVAAILATLLNLGPGEALARAQALAWAHAYGSAGPDDGRAIAVDQAGNSYVTGYFTGTLTFGAGHTVSTTAENSVFLVKHNATGALEWAVQASPDPNLDSYAAGTAVAVDAAGNAYVYGGFFGTVTFAPGWTVVADGGDSVFLAKYNSNGALQWVTQADGVANAGGIAVGAGSVHVTGQFHGTVIFGKDTASAKTVTSTYFDLFVARYHADGAVEWVSVANGRPGEFDNALAHEVAIDTLGNVYVTGGFREALIFPTTPPTQLDTVGDYDVFVAKFNGSGGAVWARSAGDAGFNMGQGIAVDGRSHLFVAALVQGLQSFLLEYDQDGTPLPAQSSGLSPLGASARSIAIDAQDNRYVAGAWINASTGVEGVLVAKYSIAGTLLWHKLIVAGGSGGTGVALDLAGNAYVTGGFADAITFDAADSFPSAGGNDLFIARYDTGGVRQSQSITFGSLPDRIFGEPPFTVAATASSGLPVSFAASGPCSASGNTVTLTGAGTCTITASQGGDSNYLPAIDVVQSFVISPGTPPVISVGSAFNGEGQSGTTAFTFNVTLSNPSLQTVTVHYATTDMTATAGADFTAATGTLAFSPGQTGAVITIQVIGDLTVEPDETFGVALNTPVNASISATHGVGTGTIFTDDANSIEVSGTAARSLLLQTGSIFPATNIDGRYGLSSSAPIWGRGVGSSNGVASLPAGTPSVGATSYTTASGTGAARAVGFYQYRNMTGKQVSFTANADLKGTFTGTGGHATGAIYVLDPAALRSAIHTSGLSMPQFLVGRDTLQEFADADATTFPLTGLFPQAVLKSTFVTVSAPMSGPTRLTTPAHPIESGQFVTIMFDITVYQPPDGEANFGNTLEAAPIFLADENGNPAPLTPVGPMTPAPEQPSTLTLTPVTATNTVGTTATVTVAAATATGQPIEGATVFFEIASGPNAGPLGLSLTDASGNAVFSYVGAGTGTDRVHASIGTLLSNIGEIA
jgi:hypothetical protein